MLDKKTIEELRQQLIELERTASSGGFQPLAAILHLAILEAEHARPSPDTSHTARFAPLTR